MRQRWSVIFEDGSELEAIATPGTTEAEVELALLNLTDKQPTSSVMMGYVE